MRSSVLQSKRGVDGRCDEGCLKLDRLAIAEVQQFLDSGHLAGKAKVAY